MKRLMLLVVLLCALPLSLAAENRSPQQGTIVRMRMTECIASQHPWMQALSGSNQPLSGELCPEYVLVTDKVVYVIIGKTSDQLVPLAETTFFHFQNNEVLIRVDDARHESHFHVKAMMLRPEWDRYEQIAEAEASAAAHHHLEAPPWWTRTSNLAIRQFGFAKRGLYTLPLLLGVTLRGQKPRRSPSCGLLCLNCRERNLVRLY